MPFGIPSGSYFFLEVMFIEENRDAEFVDSMLEKLENRNVKKSEEIIGDLPATPAPVVAADPIKHLSLSPETLKKSVIGGYNKKSVEQMLNDANQQMNLYETKVSALENEKNFLELQIKHHTAQLEQYILMETSLKNSLVHAEQIASEIEEKAQQDAEQIIKDANMNANKIVGEALAQAKKTIDGLENTKREAYIFKSRMKMMIQSQMEMFDDSNDENWNLDFDGEE